MSSKQPKKEKNPKPTGKGKGNKQNKQRRESKEYKEAKKEGRVEGKKIIPKESEKQKQRREQQKQKESEGSEELSKSDQSIDETVSETSEVSNEVEIISEVEDIEVEISENKTLEEDQIIESRNEIEVKQEENNHSIQAENQVDDTEVQEQNEEETDIIDEIQNEQVVQYPEEVEQENTADITTETEVDPSEEARPEILPLQVQEDEPNTPLGKLYKNKISKYGSPIDLDKFLLPFENHLKGKMVIYFGEGQIFLGLAVLIFSIFSYFQWEILGLSIVLGIVGLALLTTGYASEELHITNYRIVIRRMNWVDRMFRIPRDSQYIIDEIVAFDIQRAPMNQALFISGIIPLFLFFLDSVRSSSIITIFIIIFSLVITLLSQRLGKRTISFLMSGGHQVHIGQYKGIPDDIVESFTDIVMEKNVFESDNY